MDRLAMMRHILEIFSSLPEDVQNGMAAGYMLHQMEQEHPEPKPTM